MANNRFNKQVTPKGYNVGGRVKKMGGGMSTARKDMASGFYKEAELCIKKVVLLRKRNKVTKIEKMNQLQWELKRKELQNNWKHQEMSLMVSLVLKLKKAVRLISNV